jgi:hypothetical protein
MDNYTRIIKLLIDREKKVWSNKSLLNIILEHKISFSISKISKIENERLMKLLFSFHGAERFSSLLFNMTFSTSTEEFRKPNKLPQCKMIIKHVPIEALEKNKKIIYEHVKENIHQNSFFRRWSEVSELFVQYAKSENSCHVNI